MININLKEYDEHNNADLNAEIQDLLDDIDLKKVLKNNKFNNKFMRNISGKFDLKNLPRGRANVTLEMDNLNTEVFVGYLLLNNYEHIPNDVKNINLMRIKNYIGLGIIPLIKRIYLDNINFLNADRERKNNKVIKVINPKTNRRIAVDKATYKKLFGDIKLKKVVYPKISNCKLVEYVIKDGENCVHAYMSKIYGKKIIAKELTKTPTYPDILELAEKINFTCIVEDISGNTVDKYEADKNKRKKKELRFIAHNEHMYVKERINNSISLKDIIIDDIEDIDNIYKCSYNNVIITDEKIFNKMKKNIKKEYELQDFGDDYFKYQTNYIRFDPDYENNMKIINDINGNCKNIYSCIESVLKLKGYMNKSSLKYFTDLNKIRCVKYFDDLSCQFDQNSAYGSQLMKDIEFPVPTLNDYWCKYSGEIVDYGFYYCKLNSYDDILGDCDTIYSGHATKILGDRVEKIICEYVCVYTSKIDKEILKKIDKHTVRKYIGWLQRSINIKNRYYNIDNKHESDALQHLYGEKSSVKDGKFMIEDEYLIRKTGILSNILIKELTNIDLYNFDKEFKKYNDCQLVSIKTDSLGYILQRKIMELKNELFKTDIQKDKLFDKIKIKKTKVENTTIPKVKEFKFPRTCQNTYKELIDERESFMIDAPPGYGKTYFAVNKIIPYLEEEDLTYLVLSTTHENAEMWEDDHDIECYTVQSLFKKDAPIDKIIRTLNKYDYVIIDEAVQLSQESLKFLEYFKKYTNYILLADKFQCTIEDYCGEAYIGTRFVYELVNSKIIEILKHDNIRYDDNIDKAVKFIRKNYFNEPLVREYIINNFNKKQKYDTKLNLSYYNKTKDKIIKDGNKCCTVHSFQGKTIKDENYSIHDIHSMNIRIICTAISRATTSDQITIISN